MTDNQFDDIFRNRLETHKSKVPADMWERIRGKYKDRKGAFPVRWYMLAILLLLVGLGGAYFYIYNNKEKTERDYAHKKSINAQQQNKKNADRLKNNKSDPQNISPDNVIDSADNNRVNIATDISRQSYIGPSPARNKSNKKFDNNVKLQAVPDNDKPLPGNNITNKDFSEITGNNNIDKDSIAAKQARSVKPKDSTDLDNSGEEKEDEETEPDKFSLELYASPDIPFNNISSNNKVYEQSLNDAGRMQLSYTVGARLDLRITKKISAKMGVQYTQVNEKMNFEDSILSSNIFSKNRYKNIDVPILISYKIKAPGALQASFNTGMILNIASKYKGFIPDPSGDAINIDNSSVYQRNTAISLYAGLQLSKEINKKMDVFAEPYFRYRTKNVANDFQSFRQKIHTAGISIGLKYRLFKKEDE